MTTTKDVRRVLRLLPVLIGLTGVRSAAAQEEVVVILAPRREAVLSAEVHGHVVSLRYELGQVFAEGEALATLHDLAYRVNVASATARQDAAQAHLTQIEKLVELKTRQRHAEATLAAARVHLEATERLHDNGHASLNDLANAKRDVATAQADTELVEATSAKELIEARRELALATGQLETAREELAACTLVAPYAGRVARVLVHEHEWVERGTPIVEIVDDTVLRARFLLPSKLFQAVRLGQEFQVLITEVGRVVRMTVSHVAAVLDPASRTFEVYAEIDNREGALRAGMNGTLDVLQIRGE